MHEDATGSRAAEKDGLTVARKAHTCTFCDRRIEKGERHVVWVLLPSQYDVDVPTRCHGHEECNAFWREVVGPDSDGGEIPDWDEAKREGGWYEWKANRG